MVTLQETIAIGLLVHVSPAKGRAITVIPTPEKVRTPGIEALSATSIIGACVHSVFIATLVCAHAVGIAVVVAGLVGNRSVVDCVPVAAARAISVVMLVPIPIAVFVLISVAVTIAIPVLVTVPALIAILVPVAVLVPILVFVAVLVLVAITAFIAIRTNAFSIGNRDPITWPILVYGSDGTIVVTPSRISRTAAGTVVISAFLPALVPIPQAFPAATISAVVPATPAVVTSAAVVAPAATAIAIPIGIVASIAVVTAATAAAIVVTTWLTTAGRFTWSTGSTGNTLRAWSARGWTFSSGTLDVRFAILLRGRNRNCRRPDQKR
jgi:hypothetical protein